MKTNVFYGYMVTLFYLLVFIILLIRELNISTRLHKENRKLKNENEELQSVINMYEKEVHSVRSKK